MRDVIVAIILLTVSFHQSVIAKQYNIIDIGVLPDAVSNMPLDINIKGQIVGGCILANGKYAAYLWENSSMLSLGGLPGKGYSRADGINDTGQIVGFSYNVGGDDDQHATLFDPTGRGNNIDLGTLGGPKSAALAINNSGQIVGFAKTSDNGNYYAARFDSTGQQNNVTIGPSGSRATCINNIGVAAGSALGSGGFHGMIFDMSGGNSFIDIGSLGGNDNAARAINERGQIVGEAQGISGDAYAAFFGSSVVNLGSLGGPYSKASAINNLGQTVGYAITANGDRRATLFDITGQGNNIDMNTLIDTTSGWTLIEATAINEKGWVVGFGYNPDGDIRGYLLTPVPEPATLLLLGLGGVIWRKRKH